MFAARISGWAPNFFVRNVSVAVVGRVYIHESSPRANMFFARSFSLRVSPSNSARASTVIEVSRTGCTWKESRVPSSSGLTS